MNGLIYTIFKNKEPHIFCYQNFIKAIIFNEQPSSQNPYYMDSYYLLDIIIEKRIMKTILNLA